ncbi:hypothetical protein Gotur_014382 [Gossypium turneri]
MRDDTPNERFGDSDKHSNENEGIPPNEAPSNPSHETPNRRKQTLGVVPNNYSRFESTIIIRLIYYNRLIYSFNCGSIPFFLNPLKSRFSYITC